MFLGKLEYSLQRSQFQWLTGYKEEIWIANNSLLSARKELKSIVKGS